jgi:hypothetical protein
MVGAAGFEPTTPTPPVWCATRLRYAPTGPKAWDFYGFGRAGARGFVHRNEIREFSAKPASTPLPTAVPWQAEEKAVKLPANLIV